MPRQSRYGKQQLTSHSRSHSSTLQSEKKVKQGQAGSGFSSEHRRHFTIRRVAATVRSITTRRRSSRRRLQFGLVCRESDDNKGKSNFVVASVTAWSSWQHASRRRSGGSSDDEHADDSLTTSAAVENETEPICRHSNTLISSPFRGR